MPDPYLHLPWHHSSLCRAAPALSLHFIHQDCFSSVNIQQCNLFAGEAVKFLAWSLLCHDCMKHQLHYPLSPDPTENVFPSLISLQYFQLGYFYFFSCPVKSEGLLCWRKYVSPLQCWMNGACIWPNFLIQVVKINFKIITHVPKHCSDYGYQSSQLWTGTH